MYLDNGSSFGNINMKYAKLHRNKVWWWKLVLLEREKKNYQKHATKPSLRERKKNQIATLSSFHKFSPFFLTSPSHILSTSLSDCISL